MNILDRRALALSQKVLTMFLIALGGIAMMGWCFRIPVLHTPIPKFGTMQVSVAVSFLLAGLSLEMWSGTRRRWKTLSAQICGAVIAIIGFASAVTYIAQWGYGHNMQVWFGGTLLAWALVPGTQMALVTAISFSLAGVSLYLFDSQRSHGTRPCEWLALVSALLPFIVLVGYIYGLKVTPKPLGSSLTPARTALHTALGLLVLASGVLFANPERGWVARFLSCAPEGIIARKLFPTALISLVGLGMLAEAGLRGGLYGHRGELAIVTALSAVVFGLLVHQCMRALGELESSRQSAESSLRMSEARLRMALDAANVGVWERDLRSNRIIWTEELDDIFGLEHGSFDGRFESLLQLIHPDDRATLQTRVSRVLQGVDESYRFEYRIMTTDESVRWLAARGDVLRDSDGVPVRLVGIVTDVTERKLLERELIEASNREQRRLGQDLHDDLGQWLTAIHLEARALSMWLKPVSDSGSARAEKIACWMGEALDRTRMLARGMAPAVIETGGLQTALEELASTTERMLHVRCRFVCDGMACVRNPEAALQLYRIAQEAISNALRHGNASEVEISLELRSDGRSCLFIRNNGRSIPKPFPKSSGLGLRIMRYRASLLGADVEIRSKNEGGTEVECSFSGDL